MPGISQLFNATVNRFINLQVSNLTDKWYGESQKLAAAVFSVAQKFQPTIIFIDEIGEKFLRNCTKSYRIYVGFSRREGELRISREVIEILYRPPWAQISAPEFLKQCLHVDPCARRGISSWLSTFFQILSYATARLMIMRPLQWWKHSSCRCGTDLLLPMIRSAK